MYGYRLGAIGIVTTFFIIIFSTVLMPMVLFQPKAAVVVTITGNSSQLLTPLAVVKYM
jgi:hypothetical protein